MLRHLSSRSCWANAESTMIRVFGLASRIAGISSAPRQSSNRMSRKRMSYWLPTRTGSRSSHPPWQSMAASGNDFRIMLANVSASCGWSSRNAIFMRNRVQGRFRTERCLEWLIADSRLQPPEMMAHVEFHDHPACRLSLNRQGPAMFAGEGLHASESVAQGALLGVEAAPIVDDPKGDR